jgi:PHD/YefM family antitoxin component YafN of YafNO toxin-antitoxin module
MDESELYSWYVLDQEDEYEQLLESLNTKGIREKKLVENLRRLRNQLKMNKDDDKNSS